MRGRSTIGSCGWLQISRLGVQVPSLSNLFTFSFFLKKIQNMKRRCWWVVSDKMKLEGSCWNTCSCVSKWRRQKVTWRKTNSWWPSKGQHFFCSWKMTTLVECQHVQKEWGKRRNASMFTPHWRSISSITWSLFNNINNIIEQQNKYKKIWERRDLNPQPADLESAATTNCATPSYIVLKNSFPKMLKSL